MIIQIIAFKFSIPVWMQCKSWIHFTQCSSKVKEWRSVYWRGLCRCPSGVKHWLSYSLTSVRVLWSRTWTPCRCWWTNSWNFWVEDLIDSLNSWILRCVVVLRRVQAPVMRLRPWWRNSWSMTSVVCHVIRNCSSAANSASVFVFSSVINAVTTTTVIIVIIKIIIISSSSSSVSLTIRSFARWFDAWS